MAVPPMPDDRSAFADADESGALVLVQNRLTRLKDAGRTELQLQESCAGDRLHSERVHAPKVRQGVGSSCWARAARQVEPRTHSEGGMLDRWPVHRSRASAVPRTVPSSASVARYPESAFGRARGLLGRDGLEPGGGMLIDRAGSVHMFFMRFPIDVVFLARDHTVVGVRHGSGRGASRPRGGPSPRSSCRREGLPRRVSKRETGSSSRTSPTPETAEFRSIYERPESSAQGSLWITGA